MRFALIVVLSLAACGSREDAADAPPSGTQDVPSATPASTRPSTETENKDAFATPRVGRPPADSSSACMMQGSERLDVRPQRAVGTEPFWSARIDGRCVHYSHPEDQQGTRVWTRYVKGPDGEVWSGALGGRRFELRIKAERDCSDGMSDKRYPLAAKLTVQGEQRQGCAEPI